MGYILTDFSSTRKLHGQMNQDFYPKDMSKAEKLAKMRANKQKIATQLGLPGYGRIFIFIQKQYTKDGVKRYNTGDCYELTVDDIQKYPDLYDLDKFADSVKVDPRKGTKNVAVGFNVSDCMVPKIVNRKTGEFCVSHWGGLEVDRGIVEPTMYNMLEGSNMNDIHVYSSPFAHIMYYKDSEKLRWANDESIWGPYKQKFGDNGVSVDVESAIFNQLKRYIPEENIHFSPLSTNTADTDFYSNALKDEYPELAGRFLSGISVIDTNDSYVFEQPYVKILGRYK